MIDTHSHISKRFCDVIEKTVGEVKRKKIKVILAASNIEESKENIALAKKHQPFLYPAVGIHPQCTDPKTKLSIDEQINYLDDLISKNKIVAVGETGLDYSEVMEGERERGKKEQKILFRGQIALALKHKLPLMIHARKAVDEVIEILSEYRGVGGVFHCYAGGKKRIEKILNLGSEWYFGMDGNLTYEAGLADVVRSIAENRLLAETDAPFLTPVPHRGKTNKPIYVEFVYKKIAEIWGKNFEETEKIIDKNANRLFRLESRQ